MLLNWLEIWVDVADHRVTFEQVNEKAIEIAKEQAWFQEWMAPIIYAALGAATTIGTGRPAAEPANPSPPPPKYTGGGPRGRTSDALNHTIQGVENVVAPSGAGATRPLGGTRPPYVAPAPPGARPTLEAVTQGRVTYPAEPAAAPPAPAVAPATVPVTPAARATTPPPPVAAPLQPATVQAARAAAQVAATPAKESAPNSPVLAKPEDPKTVPPKAGNPDLIDAKRAENVKLRESLDWKVTEALSRGSQISKEIGEISERIKDLNKAKPLSANQSELISELKKENIENNNQLAMNTSELEKLDRQIVASQLTPYEKLTTSSRGKVAKERATASGIDLPSEQPPTSGRLAGDHLYSLRELAAHPDFVKLTPAQQNALAHHSRNVLSMDFNANSSKGRLSWAEWRGWEKYYSPAARNKMLKIEADVRAQMHAEIARLLAEGPLGEAQ